MELLDYIRKNYKTPNVAVLKTLGATNELIKYLINTPNNTNMNIVKSLISGGGDAGTGIKMVSITPAFQMVPALESLFPIYYGDERIVDDGFTAELSADELVQPVTVTITPTADVYIGVDMEGYAEFTNKGEARTVEIEPANNYISMSDICFCTSTDYADAVYLNISITGAK